MKYTKKIANIKYKLYKEMRKKRKRKRDWKSRSVLKKITIQLNCKRMPEKWKLTVKQITDLFKYKSIKHTSCIKRN